MKSEIDIKLEVEKLIAYGIEKNFIHADDKCFIRNIINEYLKIDEYYEGPPIAKCDYLLDEIINSILQFCFETGLQEDTNIICREAIAAKIMGIVTPLPSEVNREFNIMYNRSPIEATEYLYNLYVDIGYVRPSRIKKCDKWTYDEDYGSLECEISFTDIDKSREDTAFGGKERDNPPKCVFCKERVGYISGILFGQNLRLIALEFAGEQWHMGYSYQGRVNEQCIVSCDRHEDSEITENTFRIMLEFVDRFPHYFLGTDADLPMLGKSAHKHFVGGSDILPIEHAHVRASFCGDNFPGVFFHILKWPVSTIRIEGTDIDSIVNASNYIFNMWRRHTDEDAQIFAFSSTGGETVCHNSVSAVARKSTRGNFEIDIFLRNNKVNEHCPKGLFNTPVKHENIKRTDIRLIDLMGRMVMPGELDNELLHVMAYIMNGNEYVRGKKQSIDKHEDWIQFLQNKYGIVKDYNDVKSLLRYEIGRKFSKILKGCGVYKLDDAENRFHDFMLSMGLTQIETQYSAHPPLM